MDTQKLIKREHLNCFKFSDKLKNRRTSFQTIKELIKKRIFKICFKFLEESKIERYLIEIHSKIHANKSIFIVFFSGEFKNIRKSSKNIKKYVTKRENLL
jgi:hypothetical protein